MVVACQVLSFYASAMEMVQHATQLINLHFSTSNGAASVMSGWVSLGGYGIGSLIQDHL